MTPQQAFLTPATPFLRRHSLTQRTTPRRPSRRALAHRACVPPENEDENRSIQLDTAPRKHDKSPNKNDGIDEAEQTFSELDELAEEWIGANLARWEWYERMKSRRKKMLCVVKKREEQLNQEFEELRRTFMEFDALFGTNMLDDESSISPAGWGTVALIMVAYVALGYWMVELVVKIFTDYSPGFPL